jgi:hypothetical protein
LRRQITPPQDGREPSALDLVNGWFQVGFQVSFNDGFGATEANGIDAARGTFKAVKG